MPNPALRGSIRPAPGLGVLLTPCVIHWRLKRRRFGLGAGTSMAMAALGGAGLAGERREGHSGRGLWCKGGACARAGSGRTQARVTQGWGGLQKAWPWRSGGGESPVAVLRQPSGPRPKFLGEKGGTGLQGAHLGVGSKEGPAQRGRRREPAAKTTRSPGRSRCGRRGRRRKVRGGSWRCGGAEALLGRSFGVVEGCGYGGAEEVRAAELARVRRT